MSTAEGYIAQHDEDSASPRSSISSVQSKKKIPPRIVQNAVGLAIFSCMRSGLWKSGSGGSGILVARKSDGRWSPPSGLLLHTAALGFVIGVDVYDCVLVINSMEDLEMFTHPKTTLGADVELAVGPVMSAGRMESDVRNKNLGHTVLTYLKARGEHRAVNIDGSLVTERSAENHKFYGREVSVLDILAGQVPPLDAPELKTLYEVIKSAEGRVDFNAPLLEKLALQPAPGDALIESSSSLMPLSPGRPAFGVPDNEDPDPFGVKALEMAGLEIREAGSGQRPSSSQFDYQPSPASPLFGHFNNRRSTDTYITQSNRASYMSSRSNRTNFSRMTDAFTQTSIDTRVTTPTSDDGRDRVSVERLPVVIEPEEAEIDYTQVDDSPIKRWSQEEKTSKSLDEAVDVTRSGVVHADGVSEGVQTIDERDEDADDEDGDSDSEAGADTLDEAEDEDDEFDLDDDEEEPVVFEVYEAKAIQPARTAIMGSQVTQITHAKGALVNIPKRIAPPLPLKSPARASRSDFDIPAKSPLRNSLQSQHSRASSRASAAHSEAHQSMDHVVDSTQPEVVATNLTPASPRATEAETAESEQLVSGDGQHDSAAIYTTIMENRLSLEDMPKTPSTMQGSGQTSSGDEQEPRTPKPEDELAPIHQDMGSEKVSHDFDRTLAVESA